jgi:hypothetical protein
MSGDLLICNLDTVRGGESDIGFPVQLVLDGESRSVMVRAINEGGYACTDVDLIDLTSWLHKIAPNGVNIDAVTSAVTALAAGEHSD